MPPAGVDPSPALAPEPDRDPGAAPTGVLSAATVGWVAPPPEPVATGKPGWVIAGVGPRLGAWLLDGIFGFLLLFIAAIVFGIVAANIGTGNASMPGWVVLIAVLGFYFVYFVGFWTSQAKATPGMRLFRLQVANAADGKRLTIGSAVTRWLALGYAISILGLIPVLSSFSSLAALIWSIVLLITTNQDTMHQGLHDRWARTVVVRPEGAGAGRGVVVGCLFVAIVIGVLFLLPIVAVLLYGTQVSTILSSVGQSI